MRVVGAELVERREVVPGQVMTAWHSPSIVSGARAGQYVHVYAIEAGGLPVRRPFPIVTADAASGTLTIHGPGAPPHDGWLNWLRPGDTVDMIGPLGRPFEVDSRSRHLLLIAEGPSIARRAAARRRGRARRPVRDAAVRRRRRRPRSTRRACCPTRSSTSSRPPTARWAIAGPSLDLVLDYEGWADQAFAAGSPSLLGSARGAGGRSPGAARASRRWAGSGAAGGRRPPGSPEARRKAWLQVLVEPSIGCAAGTCLGCVVAGTGGPVRACREGPAFAADELDWGQPA